MTIPPDLELPPEEPNLDPPLDPAVSQLPFGQMQWQQFELLCLRLAQREADVAHAQRFGTEGQSQSGIDIYARGLSDNPYSVYQCRRVASLTAGDLGQAVDAFIAGEWSDRAERFVLCTSFSTRSVQLAEALETQADRLQTREPRVELVVWDADHLSVKLQEHPDLVRQFFGEAWLAAFLPAEAAAELGAQIAEMQETLTRVETAVTERVRVFVFDWDPEQARKELAELANSDAELFERFTDRLGNPPEPLRVANLVDERPDWLWRADARPWRILAILAEKAGEWTRASVAWNEAADRATQDDDGRAGLLVAAAVAANVDGDRSRHDALLAEAKTLSPGHPRVALQELDQTLGGQARLEALAGIASDDPTIAALIACHRALAHLLLAEMGPAREALREAQDLNPKSAVVRMVRTNVAVQQARLDSYEHRPLDYTDLVEAHAQALSVLDDLRRERRFDESVRALMLAADALSLAHEPERARTLLMSALPEELTTADGPEVLGDAAVRAVGWNEALRLTDQAEASPGVDRIRACALAEGGSLPQRLTSIEMLDRLIEAGGPEAAQAAGFRLGLAIGAARAACFGG